MSRNIVKFSPLTEASFYTLLALVEPLHGYGIIKKVEKMSGGRVRLAAGTLYGAISSLLRNQLIELVDEENVSRKRKMYKMTLSGQDLINYEIKRLQEMVRNGLIEMEV